MQNLQVDYRSTDIAGQSLVFYFLNMLLAHKTPRFWYFINKGHSSIKATF